MRKIILWIVILVMISSLTNAALIRGKTYDLNMDNKYNVIVTIDSTPKQAVLAEDGSYEFFIPAGNYTIRADYYSDKKLESTATENMVIANEKGFYTLDLVLKAAPEANLSEPEEKTVSPALTKAVIAFLALIFASMLVLIYLRLKKQKTKDTTQEASKEEAKKEPEEKEAAIEPIQNVKINYEDVSYETPKQDSYHDKLVIDVIEFIKSEGGSTTQKDIRKNFPSSEAKISLVLTELEHAQTIQKIKKGRGNIIVLR